MARILLIEDDPVMGQIISLYLTGEGFVVYRAETAEDGSKALGEFMPDVILLDLLLPDSDGANLCNDLRKQTGIPILVVSSKHEVSVRIKALTDGADDYLTKPFSMQELKARIIALLRRSELRKAGEASSKNAIANAKRAPNKLVLDPERRLIIVNGSEIETTYSEWELMKKLYSNPGKVFHREELIHVLRGFDSFVNERAVDVHIMNLRKKIEDNPKDPRHILTVRKIGYKFVPE